MSFSKLYERVQSRECHLEDVGYEISEDLLIDFAESDTQRRVTQITYPFDPNKWAGFYLCASNLTHEVFGTGSSDVIVLPETLPDRWKKIVCTKELMHIFEPPNGTQTDENLRVLIGDLYSPYQVASDDIKSETKAFWRATSLLCAGDDLQKLIEAVNSETSDFCRERFAEILNIPVRYVNYYFRSDYLDLVARFRYN